MNIVPYLKQHRSNSYTLKQPLHNMYVNMSQEKKSPHEVRIIWK